jgi:pimeloyl-ACP methyl ester carboxylesterase
LRADVLNADTLRFFNAELFTTFDTRPLLERITAPTLILYAEQDFITGPACARDLIDGIPRATVARLNHAGHMSWIEQPDAFRRAILGFLAVS